MTLTENGEITNTGKGREETRLIKHELKTIKDLDYGGTEDTISDVSLNMFT